MDTTASQALRRVRNEQLYERINRKRFGLRKLIAGDTSQVAGSWVGPQAADMDTNAPRDPAGSYDILVTEHRSGQSNKLLQSVKTLLLQSSFTYPTIEFEGLEPEEAAFHEMYCRVRLGQRPKGCDAVDQMRQALSDCLITGLGWSGIVLDHGVPVIRWLDSMQVKYDHGVKLLPDIRWVSIVDRRPAWEWASVYGAEVFSHLGLKDNPDQLIDLDFYYDTIGEMGTHYVFVKEKDEPIYSAPNPFYFQSDGRNQPFLPVEPIYFMQLPSVRAPIGIVEMMVGNQLTLWKLEEYMLRIIEAGTPYYQAEKGAMSDDDKEKFERGDVGMLVEREPGTNPILRDSGIEIPNSVMAAYQFHDKELVANSGANPYASGNKVEGVRYAAEVNAIQSTSSLVAGAVAREHAVHWQRTVAKWLAAAKLYDDQPLRLRYDGVDLHFDEEWPVSLFLRDDAQVVVRDDQLSYQTRDQRIREAMAHLQVAQSVAGAFPNAIGQAFEEYLRAQGVLNLTPYLEQRAAMDQAAQAQAAMAGN